VLGDVDEVRREWLGLDSWVAGSLNPWVQGVGWRSCEHSGDGLKDLFEETEVWGKEICFVLKGIGGGGAEASKDRFHDLTLHG
jgi:hypothetical protein